jgi:hypothetical protein
VRSWHGGALLAKDEPESRHQTIFEIKGKDRDSGKCHINYKSIKSWCFLSMILALNLK